MGRIRSDWGRKQPKTCVWVSAVEGRAFLQRSRFVSQDPIGLAGGENFYTFAPNVLGWVDYLGLEEIK